MAKPDLGTKRLCANCAAKFYDLDRDPIVCPKCETVFVVPVTPVRARAEPAKPVPVPVAAVVEPETADADFVSLDDAEAEQQGKKKPAAAGAAGEEAEDTMDAFIEEEEGTADVSDIVGEGEKEEET